MPSLTERHADQILGTISCFDRVVLTGTLPDICYARAMKNWLYEKRIRLFDYPRWAEPFRNAIRENAVKVAGDAGLEVQFVRRKDFRMADRVKEIIAKRGDHPGLVHVFSVMEACLSYRPWHDKPSGRTMLKYRQAQCIHYYFYFIDEELGLCHLKVPTWAPFPLQFYFNGHDWLARRLQRAGIAFTLVDNAFVDIADFEAAQKLANDFSVRRLHERLDRYAQRFCSILDEFPAGVHWSMRQIEYATDIVWRRPDDLARLYDALVRTSIHSVKADTVATFLGRRHLSPLYQGELGSDLSTRIQGTRIRHQMGPAAIKMYDKHGRVLRIETTTNDVAFFKHRRKVEHRNGTTSMKVAPVRKTIYSIGVVAELFGAANRRYLEFLSAMDDPGGGIRTLERLAHPVRQGDRRHRGFNFFGTEDLDLLVAVVQGEFTITGLRNRDLRERLAKSSAQVSRMLKRLRVHGLVKKVGRTYKYYLTRLGRTVAATALRLREEIVLPGLATAEVPT